MPKAVYWHRISKTINFLHAHTELFESKRVLDVGGKRGLILNSLDNTALKALLDVDTRDLKPASNDVKINADIAHLPFRDNSFDLAIFTEVLEHLENPQPAIHELARVCNTVLMTTPNNSLLRRVLWKLRRKNNLSHTEHVREYSPKEIKKLFFNAHYELLVFRGIEFIIAKPGFLRYLERFPYLGSKVLMLFTQAQIHKRET